jgi:phosphoenolpyruvate carboxylase
VESLGYENASEFLAELFEVRDMIERDHMGLFLDRLDDLIFKVQLFGFHFATMDIRQDSRVHAGVLDDLVDRLNSYALGSFEKTRYSELDFHGRIRVLKQIAELFPLKREIFDDMPEGLSRDTIRSLRAAQHIQMRNGERGVHRYIISNTQSLSNILEVWLLAHCAAWGSSEVELDIVPLFETVTDLNNAVGIMRDLYELPLYRRHLEHRGGRQTIMVGFSDGTKDGGYVTANWLIYRTKTALTKLSEEYGYRVTFFDGRGGPPARGGGNTHKFYRAHGSSISSKQIHLTVQGQTISSKYGTQAAARYNVEQLVSSGLENNLFPDETRELNESEIALIDEISAASNAAYVSLKKHPRFVSYLQHMTPLTFYGQTNIGSRPTSRGKGGSFRFEDLRAIPFVGAWSQMKQNIPGYYGLGSGLNSLLQAGRKGELLELYRNSLFFRTLIENAMQSLSKTYFPLTFYLERDPEFGDFWKTLYDEARLTVRAISEVSGQAELLQNDPVTRESIRMREEMVLPLLAIQQFALAKVRLLREEGASPEKVAVYEKMVVKSLAGSVNASRNAV